MKALLSEGALPGMLRDIYVGRRSGLLHFSRGDERYAVRFLKGHIAHGESSVPQAYLGEIMVAQGLLSRPDLERATEVVRRTRKRLGLVLVEMRLIDRGRLDDALALQVREYLLRVFAWSEGVCAFDEHAAELPREYDVPLKLSTGEMILEAVRRARNPEAIRSGLGDLDRALVLSTDPLLRFQRVTLTPADGFVLSRVDGRSSARQIFQTIPLPQEEAERSLFGLLCTGIVECLPSEAAPAPPEAEARRAQILEAFHTLARRDHFEALEIARDASQAAVMAAYYRQARRFHPDAHHDPALGDLRDQLEAVFARISEAYETLRRPDLRRAYELSLDRAARATSAAPEPASDPAGQARHAEEVLRMGEQRLAEGRNWEAIGLLEGIVTVTSGLLRQRARLLLAEAYARTPRAARSAEAELTSIIDENPSGIEARLALARLYRDRGLRTRAVEHLRQVLELHPDDRGALELLATVDDAGDKPLWRRLLGR